MAVQCGGCHGVGSHIRHCRNDPGYSYRLELADKVGALADEVGSNDPGSANLLYTVEARLRVGKEWAL